MKLTFKTTILSRKTNNQIQGKLFNFIFFDKIVKMSHLKPIILFSNHFIHNCLHVVFHRLVCRLYAEDTFVSTRQRQWWLSKERQCRNRWHTPVKNENNLSEFVTNKVVSQFLGTRPCLFFQLSLLVQVSTLPKILLIFIKHIS